jgi:hypothetical protein
LSGLFTAAADIATLTAAAIAAWAAFTARQTFQAQRERNDTDSMLAIFSKLDEYWERYRFCEPDEELFYFGQILSHYEIVCYLLNEEMLSARVRFIIEAQIVDVWRGISRDPDKQALVATLETGADQFAQTRRFLKSAGAII